MFVKIAQLSKIKKTLQHNDIKEDLRKQIEQKYVLVKHSEEKPEPQKIIPQTNIKIDEDKLATPAEAAAQNPIQQTVPQATTKITAPAAETQPVVIEDPKPSISERLFTDGIFELGDQLVKLREIHVSGLISNDEYTLLREKWIDAVLSEPLFGKKRASKVKTKKVVPAKVKLAEDIDDDL